MQSKILFVDDQEQVLYGLQRTLRGSYDIEIALGGEAGLAHLSQQEFAVVVSDLSMPHMSGMQFLKRVEVLRPEVVRIVLTGHADLDAAITAVNEGHVYQFLTKPCPADTLHRALTAAIRQHALLMAERDLLEQTLGGAIALMGDLLSLINPVAFGEGSRIRQCVRHMAARLQVPNLWEYDLAALLSRVGLTAVPGSILDKLRCGLPLTREDQQLLLGQSEAAHHLIARIPRLEVVAEIVRHQSTPFHALRDPQIPETIRQGAQMLSIASHLDKAQAAGWLPEVALADLRAQPQIYDPRLVATLSDYQPPAPPLAPHCAMVHPQAPGLVTLSQQITPQ